MKGPIRDLAEILSLLHPVMGTPTVERVKIHEFILDGFKKSQLISLEINKTTQQKHEVSLRLSGLRATKEFELEASGRKVDRIGVWTLVF